MFHLFCFNIWLNVVTIVSGYEPLVVLNWIEKVTKNNGHQNKRPAAHEDDLSVWTVITIDSGEVLCF